MHPARALSNHSELNVVSIEFAVSTAETTALVHGEETIVVRRDDVAAASNSQNRNDRVGKPPNPIPRQERRRID